MNPGSRQGTCDPIREADALAQEIEHRQGHCTHHNRHLGPEVYLNWAPDLKNQSQQQHCG